MDKLVLAGKGRLNRRCNLGGDLYRVIRPTPPPRGARLG